MIPGGTYKGNDNDVETVAFFNFFGITHKCPEDVQYGVVKGLFGNKKAAKVLNGHAKGKAMTLDTAFDGVPIPLCKGAEKFYKEFKNNYKLVFLTGGAKVPPVSFFYSFVFM